jgi:hypothetical protein
MGIKGEEIQTKGINILLNKIITENFPNLEKERVIQVQEAHRTPNCQDQNRNTLRHIIIKTLNIQNNERILRAIKEKRQATYKGQPIRITADFSTKTLNARSSSKGIIQALKESNCQTRLVYPAKLFFLIEGEIKTFYNNNNKKATGNHDSQASTAENTYRTHIHRRRFPDSWKNFNRNHFLHLLTFVYLICATSP